MDLIDILSAVLFISFAVVYILKLVLMRVRNKIDANVLTKGNKESSIKAAEVFVRISSFLWLLAWLLEILFHTKTSSYLRSFYNSILVQYLGIAITAFGVIIFTAAVIFMKSSWRVGIDKNTKTSLITDGIYKISRNPAFVGFDLMSVGLFITYPDLLTLFVTVFFTFALHRLMLQEEKHLESVFGEEYLIYKEKLPRYLLIR